MCQQPGAFLFLCQILSHDVSYSCSKMLAYGKKPVFSQDVLNTHGFVRTRLYIRKFFCLIMISLWGIDLEGVKDLI